MPVTVTPFAPQDNVGYGLRPLPSPRDHEIEELLTDWVARGDWNVFNSLTPREANVLSIFAEWAASLSRRRGDPQLLRRGLTAAALSLVDPIDFRDALPALALLWRTAEVLGLDAADEFRAAAEGVPGGEWLRDFAKRTPEDRSLDAMGFEEGSDEDGFRYIRTW